VWLHHFRRLNIRYEPPTDGPSGLSQSGLRLDLLELPQVVGGVLKRTFRNQRLKLEADRERTWRPASAGLWRVNAQGPDLLTAEAEVAKSETGP
jgi:hypothetical protein